MLWLDFLENVHLALYCTLTIKHVFSISCMTVSCSLASLLLCNRNHWTQEITYRQNICNDVHCSDKCGKTHYIKMPLYVMTLRNFLPFVGTTSYQMVWQMTCQYVSWNLLLVEKCHVLLHQDNSVRLWKINPELKHVFCLAVGQGHTNDVGALGISRLYLMLTSQSYLKYQDFYRAHKKGALYYMDV